MASYYYVGTGVDDGAVVYPSGFYNDGQNWVGNGPNHSFFRLSNVTIPKGAIIDHAYINIYVYAYDGPGEYKFRIYGVAEDNPTTITSYSDYFARTLTTNYSDWTVTFEAKEWYHSSYHDCPDIKDIIQEIVNRSGWVSGNHLMLMAKNNASTLGSVWDYYEDTGYELELEVEYHVTTTAPLINCSTEAKTPTIQAHSNILIPAINVNVGANVPNVSANKSISVPSVVNVGVTCEQSEIIAFDYDATVIVPTINVNVVGYTNQTIKDFDNINVISKALDPEVKVFYTPPVFVEPIVKDIFQQNRYEEFKYELLTLQGGEYIHSGWITDYVEKANININFTRDIIGTANFSIRDNTDINYLSDLIRPWYIINGSYNYPLGTYMLSVPTKKSNGMLINRDISAFDLLLALDQDKTITSTSYTSGSNVIDTIKTILSSVGAWVKYDIAESSQVLSTDVSYELGKSKLFIVNSLLNMINYYPLWADGNGIFRAIPWSNNINTCYEFIDNNLSIYKSGIDLSLDFTNIYNRVVVIANQLNSNTAPLYKVWTLENENLANHPFSYTSIGRYVTKIFNSDAVSQDYVDLRARRELLKMLELEESVNYSHAFISSRSNDGLPWQGDGYRFKNTLLDVDSIYKLENITFDLDVGSLAQTKIKRVRSTY